MTTARKTKTKTAYHHGDLRLALREAANSILEEEGVEGLSLRAVARRAGVSHAAPYRHYPNHETLLVEMALDGFAELRATITAASAAPNTKTDRITGIGAAYMRFVARHPALMRLMFGATLRERERFPELAAAADEIGVAVGAELRDPALGLAVWAAVHGLATLILEDVIDLGQRQAGLSVLPSRAEIVLRSLFSVA